MRFSTLTAFASVFLFAACASSPTASKAPETVAKPEVSTSTVNLAKGMTTAEVSAALGDPFTKRTIKTAGGDAEVWIYKRSFEEFAGSRPVGTTVMQEYGTINPAGETTSVARTGLLIADQYHHVDQVTSIMFVGGRVVEWDRAHKDGPSYTR